MRISDWSSDVCSSDLSNGFLGSALLEALRARGTAIRLLVRRPPPAGHHGDDDQVVVGDLGDPDIVSHAVRGVEAVYHVGASMRGSAGAFEAGTVRGTRDVVRACREHGVRKLVCISSHGVHYQADRKPSMEGTEDQ